MGLTILNSVSYDKAGNLALTCGLVLVASWLVAFVIVFLMPLALWTSCTAWRGIWG